jgi:hypothetical protein
MQAVEAFSRSVGIKRVTRLLHVLPIIQFAFWISECDAEKHHACSPGWYIGFFLFPLG